MFVNGVIEMGLGSLRDYYVIVYGWTTGEDLDTRTRIVSPVTGSYLGWGQSSASIAVGSGYVLRWGEDETETGYESVLVNVRRWREGYSQTSMNFELRAQWYAVQGTTPVVVSVRSYVGGDMYVQNNLWTNANYTSYRDDYPTFSKLITLNSTNPNSLGQYMTGLTINLATDSVSYY